MNSIYTITKFSISFLLLISNIAMANNNFTQALKDKGTDYQPRTEHFNKDGSPKYTNALILSDSPYLLQHAHNPVDWHSWSDATFAKAKKANKPIFLSVGYSTCHWCHVMERESFENEKIAEYLNQHFIAIKVDREQMPDVDNYYMNALMRIQGSGGWPMSVFLLPDLKPFHGETYSPPEQFLATLQNLQKLWHDENPKVTDFANNLAKILDGRQTTEQATKSITKKTFDQVTENTLETFDELQGGFSQAPKFPHENLLLFLIEQNLRHENKPLKQALITTLNAMANGGIYDQVGGGFHRYSTDNAWLVPHFEKMLYNQAMLARVYTKAWQLTGDVYYRRIATQTLDYVLREMQDSDGGFYTATDADSGESEGEYFVWNPKQLKQTLSQEEAGIITQLSKVDDKGNFEGETILHVATPYDEVAKKHKLTTTQLFAKLDTINQKLLTERNKRPKPFLDKKILSAWNGLMITALAEAAVVFDNTDYAKAAAKASQRVLGKYHDGVLPRIINSQQFIDGTLNDYAFMLEAELALYDQSQDANYLTQAKALVQSITNLFLDKKYGDYFLNKKSKGSIPQMKDPADGAIYSGNSALYRGLQRLFQRTGDDQYEDAALKLLGALSTQISAYPDAFAYMLAGHADALENETDLIRHAARGNLRIQLKTTGKNSYAFEIAMKDKWHINSDKPLEKNLIPTQVKSTSTDSNLKVEYPEAVLLKLGFSKEKMSLFQGKTRINFTATQPQSKVVLSLQACDDKNCLAPETLKFTTP